MGEIADMIVEGDMCECGQFIFDENGEATMGDGYPRLCPDCEEEENE